MLCIQFQPSDVLIDFLFKFEGAKDEEIMDENDEAAMYTFLDDVAGG